MGKRKENRTMFEDFTCGKCKAYGSLFIRKTDLEAPLLTIECWCCKHESKLPLPFHIPMEQREKYVREILKARLYNGNRISI